MSWLSQVNGNFVINLCEVIILCSMTHCLSLAVSLNFECAQKRQWQCLSVLNQYTDIFVLCIESIKAVAMSVVCHLLRTSQPLSTCHSLCNQSFFGLYQVFLSNWRHSGEHCSNTSAAGPSAICKKSTQGLWKLDKDSLQINYPVLGLLKSTPSDLTELCDIK